MDKLRTLAEEFMHIKKEEGQNIFTDIYKKIEHKKDEMGEDVFKKTLEQLTAMEINNIAISRKIDELVKIINETIILNDKQIHSCCCDKKDEEK